MDGHEQTSGPERSAGAAVRRADERGGSRGQPEHPVLQLQRSAGNAAVASAVAVQRAQYAGEIHAGAIQGTVNLTAPDGPAAGGSAPPASTESSPPDTETEGGYGYE